VHGSISFNLCHLSEDEDMDGFDVTSNLNAEDILMGFWSGHINTSLLDNLKKVIFFNMEDNALHGIVIRSGIKTISRLDVTTDKIIFYEGQRFNLREFVTSNVDCYFGIVNLDGSNTIIQDGKRYVNRRNIANATGLVDYPIDHNNLVKAFVEESVKGNIPGLHFDTKYNEDEMYKFFTDFATINHISDPLSKKPWRTAIKIHATDISSKSGNPITRDQIRPHTLVRATTTLPSVHICYFVFKSSTPPNIKVCKSAK